jgi:glucose/mannose-6-phosphate isomerase
MLGKIAGLPDQIQSSWNKGRAAHPHGIRQPHHIVVSGMGGSAIAGDLLRDLLFGDLSLPLSVNRGYDLPAFVNRDTLLLVSSYSGNTEETLSALQEGFKRKAMIAIFTSNGAIAEIAHSNNVPLVVFPEGYPPRSALGFSFFSMLGFLKTLLEIPIDEKDMESLAHLMHEVAEGLMEEDNEIAQLAKTLLNHLPVIHISCRLSSVAFRWQTQINENGKTFAHWHTIPEANHNEIVGLANPEELVRKMHLIFLRAPRYENPQITKRFLLTKRILLDTVGSITAINATGNTKIEEMFSLILKGDFLSFYLSKLLGVDPTPVARIDELKRGLKEK